jgi:hypothetical protein
MATLASLRIELAEAVDTFDKAAITQVVRRIVRRLDGAEDPVDGRVVLGILDDLRRKRHHDHIAQVADAAVRNGGDRPAVRRRYVQALLHRGMVAAAIDMRSDRHG